MPKPAKRHLGLDAVKEKEIVDAVMAELERCIVVAPSMIGLNTSVRHGTFGVDEPHPFPELVDPHARRAGS